MKITIKPSHRIVIWAAVIAVAAGLSVSLAQAAETTTVKATVTFSGPRPTILPAGDDKAHVVGLGQRTGKAVFKDGRKAKYSNVFFMDLYPGQNVSIWGYTKMAFDDGSWFFFKWDSQVAGRDQAGKPMFKGAGTILKGTGQYQGIEGKVEFQNKQLPPSEEYPEGATEAEAVFIYTLP